MELDELKLQLRQKLDEAPTSKSEMDIGSMLKQQAKTVVHKLKRNLQREIFFSVAITLAFAYLGLFSKYWSLRIYFSTFTIICILFVVVLVYLQKRIQQLSSDNLSIKINLQIIHSIIKSYVKRSFQFTMALIPICLVFSFWLGYNEQSDDIPFGDGLSKHLTSTKQVFLFLGVYIVLLTVGVYYFTKWYLKKLYGNYLIQLQQCINELAE